MAIIGFCSVEDIRNRNVKFTDNNVSTSEIETQIEYAEDTIIADLSDSISEADLTAAAGSKVLKNLCIYKSMEMILVNKHGYTREIDSTTDVDYWMKKYGSDLQDVIDGKKTIIFSGDSVSPISVPKITSDVTQIFTQRDVDGFEPEYDSNENRIINR